MEEQGHDVLFYENTDGAAMPPPHDHKQNCRNVGALSFVYLAQKLGLKGAWLCLQKKLQMA